MVEMILAGVIVGAVAAVAAVTGLRERRARRRPVPRPPRGEPIPGGWAAPRSGGGAVR
ncbi:hypothetical protein [Glycomyces paridis]|uniref:hypothetical protein n=1 Tax=Glycomyces paridis TaxID=2126555 RepID=UPI001305468D|nr:hypothetical protein [Glycomyces paridis]